MNIKPKIYRLDLASRAMVEKSELIRIVKTKDNQIMIDLNNNILGRGAYLKKDRSSILAAQKRNLLAKALHFNVSNDIYEQLLEIIKN